MTIVIDARQMQPPEPLHKTLEALDVLAPGDELQLLLYCHPTPLFQALRNNGFVWQEDIEADGTHRIRIHHAASPRV